MQTITTTVYSLDELSKEARARALGHFRDINVDGSYWSDPITEEAKRELQERGYDNVEVMFSGFGSQGDGACFTASLDLPKWFEYHKNAKDFPALHATLDNIADDISATITHNWRYYYAASTDVNVELVNDEKSSPEVIAELSKLEDEIKHEREQLGNKVYRDLERCYFDLLDDEEVAETVKANDYLFTARGDVFRQDA